MHFISNSQLLFYAGLKLKLSIGPIYWCLCLLLDDDVVDVDFDVDALMFNGQKTDDYFNLNIEKKLLF